MNRVNDLRGSLTSEEMKKITGGREATYIVGYYDDCSRGEKTKEGYLVCYNVTQKEVWRLNIWGRPTTLVSTYEEDDSTIIVG